MNMRRTLFDAVRERLLPASHDHSILNGQTQAARSKGASIYDGRRLRKHEIWLLRILPGEWNAAIKCQLQGVSLSKKPAYYTFSCTWGAAAPKHTILVDGLEFEVSSNLFEGLRRIRAHDFGDPFWIWVDAVCINQSNTTEKNLQVPLMGDIYANGTRNLIWLGELPGSNRASVWFDVDEFETESEHSPVCLCHQRDVGADGQAVRSIITAQLISWAIPALMRLATVRECNDFRLCRIFRSPLEILAFQHFAEAITSNSWFQRIWVVREVVRASQSTCLVGDIGFPFQALQTATMTLFKHFKNWFCPDLMSKIIIKQVTVLMHTSVNLDKTAHGLRGRKTMDIFQVRLEFPGRKASLDVDLVYGVLGITTKTLGITPDYNLLADVVFTNLSRTCIQSQSLRRSLWIFAFAPLRNRYPNLPSRAIDWTIFDDMSEREALHMRNTVQILNNRFLGPRDKHYPRTLPRSEPVMFSKGRMLLRASYIDNIADTSGVSAEESSPHARVVRDWRSLIVSRHAPGDWYHVPEIFNNDPVIQWALAWMRMLCGEVISRPGGAVGLATTEDEEHVLTDALLDRHNLCLLRRSALHDEPEEHGVPTLHPAM
jgi:hypothetical protein